MNIDSVYILAFDGWQTELRSNRWHFATRWARVAPVVLVQPQDIQAWEPGEARADPHVPGLEILKVAMFWNGPGFFRRSARMAGDIAAHMRERGHVAPLLWIYDPRLVGPFSMLPAMGRILHATENYFDFPGLDDGFVRQAKAAARTADLVIAVSEGVGAAYAEKAGADVVVSTNGCDWRLFSSAEKDRELQRIGQSWEKVAIYAGNVNSRIDFPMLEKCARENPKTLLAIYGPASGLIAEDEEHLRQLRTRPNVILPGPVDPERLPALYKASDVGLIPYRHDRFIVQNGFPLKAFEMIAGGLPVVSTLMHPLKQHQAPWFRIAETEAEFLEAAQKLCRKQLSDPDIQAMAAASKAQDYDDKFDKILSHVEKVVGPRSKPTADLSHFHQELGYDWGAEVEVIKTRFESRKMAVDVAREILTNAFLRGARS